MHQTVAIHSKYLILGAFVSGALYASSGYVVDKSGNVVTSFEGECWKTEEWQPGDAIGGCGQVTRAATIEEKSEEKKEIQASADAPIESLVHFDSNKTQLHPADKAKLNSVVRKLQNIPADKKVVIEGYSDRRGDAAVNKKLSLERARKAKEFLVSKGIPANKIVTKAKGETEPVTAPATCEGLSDAAMADCLAPDRRDDIYVR